MDPNGGRIYRVGDPIDVNDPTVVWTEEEFQRRNFVGLPRGEETTVRAMNRKQRRAWAAEQRKAKR